MTSHAEKAIDLAEKITARAELAVRGLDREIVGWPGEFQIIMWEAVAEVAKSRASQLRQGER
jgi:hypothetical protein